ncbi:MAG: hypothetical protein ABSA83_22035 [Verrucomicrobiota bacterium]|jgi:hypothetical protein
MKTRIVLKSFEALSLATVSEGERTGQAAKSRLYPQSTQGQHVLSSSSEATHVPFRFTHFIKPLQVVGWEETVSSPLNDIDL